MGRGRDIERKGGGKDLGEGGGKTETERAAVCLDQMRLEQSLPADYPILQRGDIFLLGKAVGEL